MKHGVKSGLILLVFGVVLIGVNLFMINGGSYFPKLLVLGPALSGLGIAFLAFKGGDPSADLPPKERNRIHWKEAPVLSKIMWVVMGLGGLAGGFYWMISLGG